MTRTEYEARMHRVLEYIDRHLDEQLELDTLARVANFSSFHFHRLFTAWFGETLGDYLRRRRLEMAAMRLVARLQVPIRFHAERVAPRATQQSRSVEKQARSR